MKGSTFHLLFYTNMNQYIGFAFDIQSIKGQLWKIAIAHENHATST